MDIFSGSELAFSNAYFSNKRKVLRVRTDAPVQTLSSAEVPPSAGSFAFSDDELGLHNRFIIWRAEGTTLLLDEFSAKRDLTDSSITIAFPQSIVVPGTYLFVYKGMLFLVVPTQSGVHCFFMQLIDTGYSEKRLTVNRSVFSLFTNDSDLWKCHEFYEIRAMGTAEKADCTINMSTGDLIIVVRMSDLQIIRINHRFFSADDDWEEVTLRGNNVFSRIFKGKTNNSDTCDVCVVDGKSSPIVFSVHRDGMIRAWDFQSQSVAYSASVHSFLLNSTTSPVSNISIKRADFLGGEIFVVLKVTFSDHTQFCLIEYALNSMKSVYSCTLNTKYIVDYMCASHDSLAGSFVIWVIVNESFPNDNAGNFFQPYVLKRILFTRDKDADSIWENVQPAVMDGKVDSLLFDFPETEAIRNRIFDGNNYSFSVVNRAVTMKCNQTLSKQLDYNNWITLSAYVDEYIKSGMFKQNYLNAEDSNLLLNFNALNEAKMKAATVRFWEELLQTCNQLQEEDMKPLGFLLSPALEIVGIIQSSRFSVYLNADEHMNSICSSRNSVLRSFFELVEQFLRVDTAIFLRKIDTREALRTITTYADDLCQIIRSFAEHRPVDITNKLTGVTSEFLGSSFTTGYLAAALRRRILCRLRFADILSKLITTIPQILSISKEARISPRLDLAIGAHNSTITQIVSYYTVMWVALSVRLINSTNTSSDSALKQISVAQAFFKYGGPSLVKRLSDTAFKNNSGVNDEEDEEEEEEEDEMGRRGADEMDADGSGSILPPSRWDRSSFYGGGMCSTPKSDIQQTIGDQRFGGQQQSFTPFFYSTLTGSMVSLWPESTSLTLPRFLAENQFHDALKSYCELNEPFISELAFAMKFLYGLAYSGLGRPDEAARLFDEAIRGILCHDDALNGLLNNMYGPPGEEDSQKCNGDYTPVDFLHRIMMVFKAHEHSKYVIMAGEQAIKCCNDRNNPILSQIFTTLFGQHLIVRDYCEAIRILLSNPSEKLQSACLRQLLAHLFDVGETKTLVSLSYEHLTDTVATILEMRCRNDALTTANETSYEVAYAFYASRFHFDKAAKIMYDLAQRLSQELHTPSLLEKRCRTLSVVYETLKLADFGKDVIFCEVDETTPKQEEDLQDGVKNYRQTEVIAANSEILNDCEPIYGSPSKKQPRVVALTPRDIGRELLRMEARLQLLQVDSSIVPPAHSEDIVRELIRNKAYDMAWIIINEYSLPPYELLQVVTREAIFSDNTQICAADDDREWADFNRQFISNLKGPCKTQWRILISYIDLALQRSPSDARILRSVAYTFLKYSQKIPIWLSRRYAALNFGDFLRTLLDFGDLTDAFSHLLHEIESVSKRAMAGDLDVLLPYTHIDELLSLAQKSGDATNLPIEETREKMQQFFNRYETARRAKQMFH